MSRNPGPLSPGLRAALEQVGTTPPVVLIETTSNQISHWSLDDWEVLQCCDGTLTLHELRIRLQTRGLILPRAQLSLLIKRARASGLFSRPGRMRPSPPEPDITAPSETARPLLSEPPASECMPQTLPEARYHCLRCGESCSAGYDVGPLPTCTVLTDELTLPLSTPSGLRQLLPHLDGRCTQLDPKTGLCQLHARRGPESKPSACREFPVLVFLTPDGPRAALQWECTRLHTLLLSGPPLASALSPSMLSTAEIIAEELAVGDGRIISFLRYRRLEQFLLEACQRDTLDAVAFSLLPLVRSLASRETEVAWEEIRTATQASLKHRTDMFLLEHSELIAALYRQGQALEESALFLHSADRRRVYRRFCQQILESWVRGAPIPLEPLTNLPLHRAWLRNRLFGLTLARARSLLEGALELTLRWAMIRTGLQLPLVFSPEGSAGDDDNRRIIALEHGLRTERLQPVLSRSRMA